MHFKPLRRQESPSTASCEREHPVLIGRLYRVCEDKLGAIITYLHDAIALEACNPAAASLCHAIATEEIAQYKSLCRLLRDLGVPFRLQTRIQSRHAGIETDPHGAALSLLAEHTDAERAAAAFLERIAESAGAAPTRQLLLALAAEERGHAEALETMCSRMDHS